MQFRLTYHIHKDDIICLENIKKIIDINLQAPAPPLAGGGGG